MNIKRIFMLRLLTGILILSFSFSSVGITPTQASQPRIATEVPGNVLKATLDRSVNVDSFPASGKLIIHFNAAMNPDSSTNPLLSYPYIDGNTSWNTAKNTLTFTPTVPLKTSETYIFFIDPALSSLDGTLFDSSPQWNVQVMGGTQVASVSPKAGLLTTRKPIIEVTFDRPMERASTEKSFSVQPSVPYKLNWKDDRIIQIQFNELLQYGQQYTFLFAGSSADSVALAKDGTPIAEDFSWSYGLEPFSIQVPPAEERTLRLEFSHELDNLKTGLPFVISPNLEGEWKWSGKKLAYFVAKEFIPVGQIFTLQITKPLVDADGELTLTESAFQFVAPPPIASVAPSDIVSVSTGFSPIKITFETEVDHSSAEKAFSIEPQISGRFEWSKGKESPFENVLSFYPSKILQYDTQYTVKLDTVLIDHRGRPLLLETYSSTFHTVYGYYGYPEEASFGYGSKIQVVDVLGSRRVQFGSEEKQTITFEAYGYDLIDFASLYSDYIHGNDIILPTRAEKEPVATWNYIEVNPNYQETIIPPEVPPGLYVLNLIYGGRSFDQLFVALTRNTIVTKRSGDELFVWVSNINDGNMPNAEIRLYSDRGEKIREGKTDENGIYRVSIPDGDNPMLVSARTGKNNGDVSIVGLDYDWREWSSGYWGYETPTYKYLSYIYTDRPIYRPGQTVNFKIIVRRDKDVKYELPDSDPDITANVRDSKNNLVQTNTLKVNEFGTVNGSFTIAEEAALGNYTIETVINGEAKSQAFKVQDYRKPDLKVTITPAQINQSNKFVNGDKVDLNIKSEYFFGKPVADAPLKFKLYRLYPQYSWWDPSSTDISYTWHLIDDRSISAKQTDANGLAQITVPARFDNDFSYYDYEDWRSSLRTHTFAMEVTADDGSNQPVSSAFIFNVHNAKQKISIDTQGYLKPANQPFSITASTRALDDQPFSGQDLNLQVQAWDSKSYEFSDIVERYDLMTDKDGLVKHELKLPAGYYQLFLSGKDERGNSMEYKHWLKVSSSTEKWINTRRSWDPISISADQDEYKPYQTAQFAIESTVSGPALLTFERGSVIHTKFITLTAPLTVVEAEIIPEDAPNVFVTVNAWAPVIPPSQEEIQYYRTNLPDSQMMMATTELKVSAEGKELQLNITTDKQTYGPSDEITVNIDVKDVNGRPASAEVSLALVDEAIFSLSNVLSPNIFSAFYGRRDLNVTTYTSMNPARIILDQGGRGGGGDGGLIADPRADFRDTAAWFPALRTDTNGRASVTFNLPDNLTSWRLSAKAITQNHLVGESYTNIETKKDLLLRPLLPRILTTGDQAQLTTMVHNYGSTDQKVQITLNAPGLKIKGEAAQSVMVMAGEVLAVGWSVVPEVTTETKVTITAIAENSVNDTISLPLPIQPLAVKDVQSLSGKFNGAVTLTLPVLPDIMPEASAVTLKLSRTPASTVLDGLEYLTGYPYGCVEQTMSRAMPNAVLGRASTQLGVGGEELKDRVKPLIEASIQKLYGFQHHDGGWGWWYDDFSNDYQTAWVLHGLSIIRDEGYFIDPQVLEKGSKYLNNNLDEMDARTRAYALYGMALAGHGNLDSIYTLMDASLNELDPFSQAALALTLHQLGDDQRAIIVLDLLEKNVVHKGDLAYWPQSSSDGEYHRKTMSSTIRTTAMVLSAFVEIRGASSLGDAAATYLIKNRTGYGWGTTNETSFTILALTDYLSGQQEQSSSSDFTFDLNGKTYSTGTLETGNLFANIDIPIEQLHPGANTIKLSTSGTAPLYYDVITSYTTPKKVMDAAGKIVVTRRYLDPKTNQLLESITEGQLVKVELAVKMMENASFVIVEDHLPGGLEALNESLNSTTQDAVNYGFDYYEERFFWQDYGYNYKEIRGDRVSFFITEFKQGLKTFKYLARATMSGTFTALPAEAYAMYDEQIWGRSSSASTIILSR
ncbi:MAG: MG2 domain-containing protein [Anaerolineae bacterium]|nr:MG2 domain-containing protein [Anaerolineae bacterium]